MYFFGFDEIYGYELWKSDGIEVGIIMVKDIMIGLGFLGLFLFIEYLGELVFWVDNKFWKLDGILFGIILIFFVFSILIG